MRAAAPAPVCTITSRPKDLNFLTDSGVAATRVSSFAVSLRTASFIVRRSAVSPENRQQNHDQQDSDQRPFGEGQKAGIAPDMLADVHRTVLELGILRHGLPLKNGRDYSKHEPLGNVCLNEARSGPPPPCGRSPLAGEVPVAGRPL